MGVKKWDLDLSVAFICRLADMMRHQTDYNLLRYMCITRHISLEFFPGCLPGVEISLAETVVSCSQREAKTPV